MANYTTKESMLVQAAVPTGIITSTVQGLGFDVSARQRLSIQLVATAVTSGNCVFTVDVSNDGGTTWTAYNRITTNATNTNAQTDARVASVTLSATGSNFMFFPDGDHFQLIRIKGTVTTDGSYSAFLSAF